MLSSMATLNLKCFNFYVFIFLTLQMVNVDSRKRENVGMLELSGAWFCVDSILTIGRYCLNKLLMFLVPFICRLMEIEAKYGF